jgi:predicted amidophosphoribosyltransferase
VSVISIVRAPDRTPHAPGGPGSRQAGTRIEHCVHLCAFWCNFRPVWTRALQVPRRRDVIRRGPCRNFQRPSPIKRGMNRNSLAFTWLTGPLEILFPRECLVCTRPLRGSSLCFRCTPRLISLETPRCDRCFGDISNIASSICPACEAFPSEFERIRYLWEYEGLARDFIRAMKYQPSPYLAYRAGECMADSIHHLYGDSSWDIIVPVPSSPAMLKKRLFHPCSEMSRALKRHLAGASIRHALQHQGNRAPQARRSHRERLRGLRKIFRVAKGRDVIGKRVLLVEDVITTGATVAAACHTLYEAGARSVDVIALAEARVWRRFRSRIFTLFNPQSVGISGVLT